jgi:3-dehydrotetronate 4-kinase
VAALLLGCIADDFTGATDLSNNLVRAGLRAAQAIGVPDGPLDVDVDDAEAVVIALKSRTVAPADAVEQSLAALRWLKSQGARQIYFKYCSTFDSTARGNIGPVTDALLDALHGSDQGFTIVCPAFPENQRTVFKGHLFVGDVLLSDSGMRNHPLTPMTDANLVRVMQAQTRRRVGLVAQDVVARGPQSIHARFEALQRAGVQVAVLDAISNDDLMRIGVALAGMPLVTAGSGVAIGLPQNWRADGSLPQRERSDILPAPRGARAVLSGSCSTATLAQVRAALQSGVPAFRIDPLEIAEGADVAAQALAWAEPRLAAAVVLFYATAEPDEVKAVQGRLGIARAGEFVERTLSRIAVGLVERGVRQLVVAGGETSGAVVQTLGVRQMTIGPQIDPGVPWAAGRSPLCGGAMLHLALKSGNFGAVDFFIRAFAHLGTAA